MTKLCPRGKAAAKRKFRVYPSAYANAYASKICAGKIKDPSGVKRKDFRGSKAEGGRIGYKDGTKNKKKKIFKRDGVEFDKPLGPKGTFNTGNPPKRYEVAGGGKIGGKSGRGPKPEPRSSEERIKSLKPGVKRTRLERGLPPMPGAIKPTKRRSEMMGGGLMEATQRLKRQGLIRAGS